MRKNSRNYTANSQGANVLRIAKCMGAVLCKIFLLWSLSSCVFATASCSERNDSLYDNHVNVKVLVGAVTPNKVSVAVMCEVQPGWHIYAKDPGDTGMPTRFWIEGSNTKSLNVHWPKFSKVSEAIPGRVLESNVYEGTVVFPITFTVLKGSESPLLHLHVGFAVCGEVCIPQERRLEITLPSDAKFEDPEVIELIRQWKRR